MGRVRARQTGLLTRQERFAIRETIKDLERQRDRAHSPERRAEYELLIGNCQLEQGTDRDARKRDRKREKGSR